MPAFFTFILCIIFGNHIFVADSTGKLNKLCNLNLSRTQSSFIYKELKNVIYMSLCKPLRDLPKKYLSGLRNPGNTKIIILERAKASLNLLGSASGDFIYNEDDDEVKLELDSTCSESSNHLNYSVVISFECSQEENEPIFIEFRNESCSFVFKWQAPFACLLSHQDRPENCLLKFKEKSFDLTSLTHTSHYAIQRGDYKVYINFCGPVNLKDCQSPAAVISGCVILKNKTYLVENNSCSMIFLEERSRIEIEYCLIQGVKVIIDLKCNHDAFTIHPAMIYSKKSRRLHISIETSVVCLNNDRCDINFDGESYSLSGASNVMIKETNGIFLLNACGPLKSDSFWLGGESSASLINETVMSLGSKRSLKRTDKSVLTLTLTEGSFCPGTKSRAKTVIAFICSDEETHPVFLDKSEKCVFSFQWKGPSYCPVLEATGKGCEVRDPYYGMTYRLDDLDDNVGANSQNESENPGKGVNFRLNLCGKVKKSCNSDIDVSVCLLANNKEIVLGRRSSQTYVFKQGSLVFKLRGSECAPNVTSHVIVNVICEFGASDRFVSVSNESDSNCVFNFNWYTRKICPKEEPLPCTFKHQNGSVVNLNPLRLFSSNYRIPKDNDSYFLLNVCGPLWYGFNEMCPPSSAACLVEKGRYFHSTGEIYENLTLAEQDKVILVYKNVEFLPVWETVITFICDERSEGPQYIGTKGLKHSFRWKTKFACFNKTDGDGVKSELVKLMPKQIVTEKEKAEMVSMVPQVLNASFSKGVFDAEVEDRNPSSKSEGKEVSCITSDSESSIDLSVLEPVYVSFNKCVRLYVDVCKKVSCLTPESNDSFRLGFPVSRPIVDDRGFVTVNFYDDVLCGDHLNRSLSFIFVCDKSQGKGIPRLKEQTSCKYTFLWNTRVVCPNDILVLDKSNNSIKNKSNNENIAFESSLKNPIQIERESESFYINLFSSDVSGGEVPCSGNICEKKNATWISHGIVQNLAFYDYRYNRIVMEFDGGDLCKGIRRYSSKIYLNCSEEGISHPKSSDWVISRHYCELILELVTPCFEVKPITSAHVTIIILEVSGVLLVLFSMLFAYYYMTKKKRHFSSEMTLISQERQKLFDKEL